MEICIEKKILKRIYVPKIKSKNNIAIGKNKEKIKDRNKDNTKNNGIKCLRENILIPNFKG